MATEFEKIDVVEVPEADETNKQVEAEPAAAGPAAVGWRVEVGELLDDKGMPTQTWRMFAHDNELGGDWECCKHHHANPQSAAYCDEAIDKCEQLTGIKLPRIKQEPAEPEVAPEPRADEPMFTDGLAFGVAMAWTRRGYRLAREGWNGKGMWVRLIDFTGLDNQFRVVELPGAQGTLMPTLFMKNVHNQLVAWTPSQTDVLAEDWYIVKDSQ